MATYYVNIVYDANGGTGAPSTQKFSGSSEYVDVTLSGVEPKRESYQFLGWSDDKTAIEAKWVAGQSGLSVWAASEDESYEWTIYAIWSPIYYATLTFDANGGSGAPSQLSGESTSEYIVFNIPDVEPTREGYSFAGWAENPEGTGTIRYPGGTYTGYGTTSYPGPLHTLYAVWEKDKTGYVWIYYNGTWSQAEAWIYYDGAWRKAIPWVYRDSRWNTTAT